MTPSARPTSFARLAGSNRRRSGPDCRDSGHNLWGAPDRSGVAALHATGEIDIMMDWLKEIYAAVGAEHPVMNGQLIRLNSNGELDITFTPPVGIRGGNVHGLGVQSDGKIIVTGGAFALLPNVFRLNSDGTQDKRFRTEASVYGPVLVLGDDSILISSGNNGTAIGRDIRGRVVCAGSIVRLGPDGNLSPAQLQLDPSFANVPGVAVYLTP